MPPKKKTKVAGLSTDDVATATIDQLEDIMADIFGWLRLHEIMGKRCVCKKWKKAAKKTIVPHTDFVVNNVQKFNTVDVMTRALPNYSANYLQQITIDSLGYRYTHKYSDGEDPDEEYAARTDDLITHDIEIISNFSKLRVLTLWGAPLNGRYPFLFNSFPLLQKLSIGRCHYLKWDLDMLAGFPVLKELDCECNGCVTGNINSLRVLKKSLEKVRIYYCWGVEGNFMELADFPHLKELDLKDTAITGDIRDICDNDFLSMECLCLPHGVYGGVGYEFQRISDAPDLIRALYQRNKQRPALLDIEAWFARLSHDSPDWYGSADEDDEHSPPFDVVFVKAGPRCGYRWETSRDGYICEVNWLDPEPEIGSSGYRKYKEDLRHLESGLLGNIQLSPYRGLHQPPTEEEYNRLWEGNVEEIEE